MLRPLLLAIILLPAASAGHGFELFDAGAWPGPADVTWVRWETYGDTTSIHLRVENETVERGVVALAGKDGGPLQGHVRATSNATGMEYAAQGVGADVMWPNPTSVVHVTWQPALAPKTCVLVVAWAGDVEDVAPESAYGKLEDPDAMWDTGKGCSHRQALDYSAECGHPNVPAYCSPGSPWFAAPLALAVAAMARRHW